MATSSRKARFALGGVAHKPWRDPKAEAALRGQPVNAATFARRGRSYCCAMPRASAITPSRLNLRAGVLSARSHKLRLDAAIAVVQENRLRHSHGTLHRHCDIAN